MFILIKAIIRIIGVFLTWLQNYTNNRYIPRKINVTSKTKRQLTIDCDELWSFIGNIRK